MPERDHQILWRLPLGVAGAAFVLGGIRHGLRPLEGELGSGVGVALSGPESLGAHVGLLVGYGLLCLGLMAAARTLPRRLESIARAGIVAAGVSAAIALLGLVDGAVSAALDSGWNQAHDLASALVMPVLGVCLGSLALLGGLQRAIGSLAISWVGLLGAGMHAAAGPLVLAGGDPSRAWLLRGTAVLGVWLLLVAIWPVRNRGRPREDRAVSTDSAAPDSGRNPPPPA